MIMTNVGQPMSTYYGVGSSQEKDQSQNRQQQSSCQSTLTYISMIVGLLSLFTLIALNVTNITYLIGSGGSMNIIREKQDALSGSVSAIMTVTDEEIRPKINLINNLVSYSLPSQLTQIQHTIKNEVLRQCAPSFVYNNTVCPVVENPSHSNHFKELNPYTISSCSSSGSHLQLKSHVTFVDYPSFIPGSTRKGGCVRIPSFSLSDTIFAYTHNIIAHGCQDSSQSDQYLSIGRIVDHGTDIPVIETIAEWYMNDGLNRKSCSVAAGDTYAILGCTIVTSDERTDYLTPGIGRISISYLDVFGRKKEWIFSQEEIQFNLEFVALYFSVGSGVIVDGDVYFLVYGGLSQAINGNAFCHAPGCQNPNQETCNRSQKPGYFGNHQIVSGVMKFTANFNTRPEPIVTVLSPARVWLGAEGRLIYSSIAKKTYIYLRSSGWHSLAQTGIINIPGDYQIRWVDQLTLARPGNSPCEAANRCPKECLTGVYTDVFPLGVDYEVTASVVLATQTSRSAPKLLITNTTHIIYSKLVTTQSQRAAYTTTTCFVFKMRIWCMSIVEISPGAVGEYIPVPFLYQVNLGCVNSDTGLENTPSTYSSGDTYKNDPFEAPKTECYLELSGDELYFAVKVYGNRQTYKLTWKYDVNQTEAVNSVSKLCHEILKELTDRGEVNDKATTIETDYVTFTPVTLQGGIRVSLSTTNIPISDITTVVNGTNTPVLTTRLVRSLTTTIGDYTHENVTTAVPDLSLSISQIDSDNTSTLSVDYNTTNNNTVRTWRMRYNDMIEKGYNDILSWWSGNKTLS